MVFKPKKTGGVVFGYSLKVPLVCSNQAATVFFLLLALLVRWKICRRVVQILCLHGCPCLPDGHLADFFGGWGGKRIGILKFQRLKWDYQCLGYVYCKWELNKISGKSRNNELFLVLFFNHQGRPWINMNQKLRVINETVWWHEEPKFEMVSRESCISECHISIFIYNIYICKWYKRDM